MADKPLLVLAGGEVGRDALGFLLSRREPIGQVVAAHPGEAEIIALAEAADVECLAYAPGLQEKLAELRWSWLLNLWSPHLIGPALLDAAERRLNLHPALVPHCRGNDCAAWAIRKGLPAGVSLLEMDAGVDTAPVWAQREVVFEPTWRGGELQATLRHALLELFIDEWPRLAAGMVEPAPQTGPASAHSRAETNADRLRDGAETDTLENWIRWALAHDFSPAIASEAQLGDRRYRLRLRLEPVIEEEERA